MIIVKKLGKAFLCHILERQVSSLRRRHDFTIVAVVGSVGKTSTKLAIAKVIGAQKTVRHQEGNYNDRLTVPLVVFGHQNPPLFNLAEWVRIIASNQRQIKSNFEYDVVVLELGTDGPGQIKDFAYLQPEIVVVSAITPEHMEYFKTLDAVAEEELTVMDFSKKNIINTDDVDPQYLVGRPEYIGYGLSGSPKYKGEATRSKDNLHQTIKVSGDTFRCMLLGDQGAKVALAAYAVGCELDLATDELGRSIGDLRAFSGRMNLLNGVKKSTIIDDTYNASPAAVIAGLDVLYAYEASQKIAILGNMNELGETSKSAHEQVGVYCDPKKLDLVVTIGPDANKYLASSAKSNGCRVASFDSPYDVGDFVLGELKSGAIILAKGSQNRVFAEESLKVLLADPGDQAKLVRQSPYWLSIKKGQFEKK